MLICLLNIVKYSANISELLLSDLSVTVLKLSMMVAMQIPWYIRGLIFIVLHGGTTTGDDLDLCKENAIVSNSVRLHFNSTLLSEIGGLCSCRLNLSGASYIVINTDEFTFQNCTDGDTVFTLRTNQIFLFPCYNNGIRATPGQNLSNLEYNQGDILWLNLSITAHSPVPSGSLVITSSLRGGKLGHHYSMHCYNPKKNIPKQPITEESLAIPSQSQLEPIAQSTVTEKTKLPNVSIFPSSNQNNEQYNQTSNNDQSTVDPERLSQNQVSVAAISGGTVSSILVISIIVVTILYYSKRKRLSSKDKDTDPHCNDQFQMNDNYQTNNQDLQQVCKTTYNTDQSKASNSVDPESFSFENTLYESTNSLDVSRSKRPSNKLNYSVGHPEIQNIKVDITGSSSDPLVKENTSKENSGSTFNHASAPSGDVYALVTKTSA